MSFQQSAQSKYSVNGFGRRKAERDMGNRSESKPQAGKSNLKSANLGTLSGSSVRSFESSLSERLLYLATCLLGHHVEVHVKGGSVYSGIFHAANAEDDFGVVLKMARLTYDSSVRGQKGAVSKAPIKTLIIPGKELVQLVAKDVAITRDELENELKLEKQREILIDSSISQPRYAEMEKQLTPWVPDADDPHCPELEHVFDSPWNRNWDQFEVNETLFGVKSTFSEELYTTKLEKGPQMRELELQAMRIAREIEGEETQDLHLAEERGNRLEDIDTDEETRFSSVYRGTRADDSGYEDEEDILLTSHNNETFGSSRSSTDMSSWISTDGAQMSMSSSSMGMQNEVSWAQSNSGIGASVTDDHGRQMASEFPAKKFPFTDKSRFLNDSISVKHGGNYTAKELREEQMMQSAEDSKEFKGEDTSAIKKKDGSDEGERPSSILHVSSKVQEVQGEKQSNNPRGQPATSVSSTSDSGCAISASSGRGLSPSSSVGSLSSEKSTLNPHAKEFKLNPYAKSFIPSKTPVRPPSPVSDGSFYYPNVSAVPNMHNVPAGIGIGHSYAVHQPAIYNPQVAPVQSSQPFFHPTGPQYGQQMLVGTPRQMLYMPSYPPEMPYKARDF